MCICGVAYHTWLLCDDYAHIQIARLYIAFLLYAPSKAHFLKIISVELVWNVFESYLDDYTFSRMIIYAGVDYGRQNLTSVDVRF